MLCTANDPAGSIHTAIYCPPPHHRGAAPSDSNYPPLQQPPAPSYSNLGLLHEFGYPFAGPYHRGAHRSASELVAESVQDNSIHSSSVYGAPLVHPGTSSDSLAQVVNAPPSKKFWEPGQHPTGPKFTNAPDASAGTAAALKAPNVQRLHSNRPAAHSTSAKKRKRVATMAQRRAANIRERRRMFNLNEAFDKLRRKVPTFAYEKRLSRIETLKLAITYIAFMDEVLRSEKLQGAYVASGDEGPVPATNSTDNYRTEPW